MRLRTCSEQPHPLTRSLLTQGQHGAGQHLESPKQRLLSAANKCSEMPTVFRRRAACGPAMLPLSLELHPERASAPPTSL